MSTLWGLSLMGNASLEIVPNSGIHLMNFSLQSALENGKRTTLYLAIIRPEDHERKQDTLGLTVCTLKPFRIETYQCNLILLEGCTYVFKVSGKNGIDILGRKSRHPSVPKLLPHHESLDADTDSSQTFGIPSYRWRENSCWLDSSLEILFICATQNFDQFLSAFRSISESSPFHALLSCFQDRLKAESPGENRGLQGLNQSMHRDNIRKLLFERNSIRSLQSSESLMVWFMDVIRMEKGLGCFPLIYYFNAWVIDIHVCTGSTASGGVHLELVQPHRRAFFEVNHDMYTKYHGNIQSYFEGVLDLQASPTQAHNCWRVMEGRLLCTGTRYDTNSILITLPIIFSIEVTSTGSDDATELWNFPGAMYPHTQSAAADEQGLVYDLVGIVLFNKSREHFIVRYASHDRKTIYTYDGMAFNGVPVVENEAKFETDVAGQVESIPKGFSPYQAFYTLRGGLAAQKELYNVRTHALAIRHQLQFGTFDARRRPSVTRQLFRLLQADDSMESVATSQSEEKSWVPKNSSRALEYVLESK